MKNSSIESVKLKPSGDYLLFARVDGVLIKKRYSGYPVTIARKLFSKEIKENKISND